MPDFKNMPYSAFKSYVRKVHEDSERARKEEKNNPVTEITQQEDEPTPEQIVEKIKIELPKWKQQISKKASISNYFSRLIRKLEEEFNPNSDKNTYLVNPRHLKTTQIIEMASDITVILDILDIVENTPIAEVSAKINNLDGAKNLRPQIIDFFARSSYNSFITDIILTKEEKSELEAKAFSNKEDYFHFLVDTKEAIFLRTITLLKGHLGSNILADQNELNKNKYKNFILNYIFDPKDYVNSHLKHWKEVVEKSFNDENAKSKMLQKIEDIKKYSETASFDVENFEQERKRFYDNIAYMQDYISILENVKNKPFNQSLVEFTTLVKKEDMELFLSTPNANLFGIFKAYNDVNPLYLSAKNANNPEYKSIIEETLSNMKNIISKISAAKQKEKQVDSDNLEVLFSSESIKGKTRECSAKFRGNYDYWKYFWY